VSVRLHVLLTAFQTGAPALGADVLCAAAVLAYLEGVRRVRRRRHWPGWQVASFVAGAVLLFVAVGSGLAAYDDASFPLHVAQHLLIMMVAPPLLVLGRPLTLLVQASPRPLQRRIARALNSRFVRGASPAVAVAYYASMPVSLLTPLYALDLHARLAHDASHAALLLLGLAFWAEVVGTEPGPRRASHLRRGVLVFAGGPLEMGLAVVLMWRAVPLAGSTVAATHAGGQVFLIGAMTITGLAVAAILYDWARRDELATQRREAAVAAVWPAGGADTGPA
jgi:putative copper resistance protein D